MSSAELLKILQKAGWVISRVRGSHHVLKHQTSSGHLVVPHPKKDLGKGLARKILKQAGLK